MTKYFCDKCGQEFGNGQNLDKANIVIQYVSGFDETDLLYGKRKLSLTLCPPCWDRFMEKLGMYGETSYGYGKKEVSEGDVFLA